MKLRSQAVREIFANPEGNELVEQLAHDWLELYEQIRRIKPFVLQHRDGTKVTQGSFNALMCQNDDLHEALTARKRAHQEVINQRDAALKELKLVEYEGH